MRGTGGSTGSGEGGSSGRLFALTGRYGHPAYAVADVDGDARPDLIVESGSDVSVWRGCGDGTFETTAIVSRGVIAIRTLTPGLEKVWSAYPSFVADFDGDGRADLLLYATIPAWSGDGHNGMLLALATGMPDGTFSSLATDPQSKASAAYFEIQPIPAAQAGGPMPANVNDDGLTDALVQVQWNDSMVNQCIRLVSVFATRGNPQLVAKDSGDTVCVGRKGTVGRAATGKFVGDGQVHASVGGVYQAFSGPPMPSFWIIDGKGDGTYQPTGAQSSTVPSFAGYLNVSWRDLDRDGKDDAIVSDDGTHPNQIFWNDGGLTFSPGPFYSAFVQADFDGDGNLDLFGGSPTGTIVFGDGARGFGRPLTTPLSSLSVADLNGDGAADLISSGVTGPVSVYLSTAKHLPVGSPDIDCAPLPSDQCAGPTGF